MPTYTYHCGTCDQTTEYVMPMSENKAPEDWPCPRCGTFDLCQQITPIPIKYGLTNRPPQDFRNTIEKIKKANPGHRIPDGKY